MNSQLGVLLCTPRTVRSHDLMLLWVRMMDPAPSSQVHGPCFGGSLNLALTADLRYCSDDATFCVPPAKLGIGYPRGLMDLLVGAVGIGNAKDLLFTVRASQSLTGVVSVVPFIWRL
jgi:hypothetical protein